jgi:hypothetical protein
MVPTHPEGSAKPNAQWQDGMSAAGTFVWTGRAPKRPKHSFGFGQIPAGATNAPGSSLGFWRQSDAEVDGAVS